MGKTPDTIEAFDRMQRTLILEAAERGEDLSKAMERIKEQTRAPYLRLIRMDGSTQIFPFPTQPDHDPAA